MHISVNGRRAEIFNALKELIAPTESDRCAERPLQKSMLRMAGKRRRSNYAHTPSSRTVTKRCARAIRSPTNYQARMLDATRARFPGYLKRMPKLSSAT